MNYWASGDALFEDGHYVEEWELRRFGELSPAMRSFVESEASKGNKISSIGQGCVFLARPPSEGLLKLPEGLGFVCPYRLDGGAHYDCDGDGLIMCANTGQYLGPTGTERPRDDS